MHEGQRMAYLDAMGIDMFVPRVVLPNAPVPKQCALPAADAPTKGQSDKRLNSSMAGVTQGAVHGSVHDSAHGSAQDSIDNIFQNLSAGKSARAQHEQEQETGTNKSNILTPKSAPIENNQSAKFSLAIWQCDNFYIIDSHEPQAALPTQTLLQNILAFGFLSQAKLPKVEMLNWPLFEGESSWQAANEMVVEFINNRVLLSSQSQKESQITSKSDEETIQLILLGEASARAVLGDDALSDDKSLCKILKAEDRYPLSSIFYRTYLFPSLAHILREPILKAKVQQCLLNGLVHTN